MNLNSFPATSQLGIGYQGFPERPKLFPRHVSIPILVKMIEMPIGDTFLQAQARQCLVGGDEEFGRLVGVCHHHRQEVHQTNLNQSKTAEIVSKASNPEVGPVCYYIDSFE